VTRPALTAHRREITGKDVARLRRQGILPAVLYGHGEASEPIQIDAKAFETLNRESGRHALIDLKIEGGRTHQAVVHDVQEHPVRRVPLHVDFQLVKMTEEMTMDVQLVPVGTSVAVEKHNGTLLQTLDHIRLRGLPGAMPQSIEYDVSVLDSFEAAIRVRDLTIPEKLTLLTDPDESVAHVQPSRAEVELEREAATAAPAEGAEPEGETPAEE
jgi:large subunit ribosomal protein L25